MIQTLEQQTYTLEEYLEFEVASEERHEYVNCLWDEQPFAPKM